jgi:hypothetical protein
LTTPTEQTPARPPGLPRLPLSLRSPLITAGAVAVAGLVLTGLYGHLLMGVFGVLGMAMGLLNIRLVQLNVDKITRDEHPRKQQLALSSLSRLALITFVALGLGLAFRPDGLGVFAGLALFQVILVFSTAVAAVRNYGRQP